MKKNGFNRPYHKLQIGSWIYVIFAMTCFVFLALPLLSYSISVIIGIFLAILFLLVIIQWYICTYIDPIDPALIEAEKAFILS